MYGDAARQHSHSEADYGSLIADLMGPIAGGDPPPAWPPDRDSLNTDEHVAAVLSETARDERRNRPIQIKRFEIE